MTKVFAVTFASERIWGIAYPKSAKGKYFIKGSFNLPERGQVKRWRAMKLELRDGEYADFLASQMGCRLISPKLKAILDNGSSLTDDLQWLEAVIDCNGDSRPYFLLHFPNPLDALDRKASLMSGRDYVIKPVFDLRVVANHSVFTYPQSGSFEFFVSQAVQKAIKAAKCTGISLRKASAK